MSRGPRRRRRPGRRASRRPRGPARPGRGGPARSPVIDPGKPPFWIATQCAHSRARTPSTSGISALPSSSGSLRRPRGTPRPPTAPARRGGDRRARRPEGSRGARGRRAPACPAGGRSRKHDRGARCDPSASWVHRTQYPVPGGAGRAAAAAFARSRSPDSTGQGAGRPRRGRPREGATETRPPLRRGVKQCGKSAPAARATAPAAGPTRSKAKQAAFEGGPPELPGRPHGAVTRRGGASVARARRRWSPPGPSVPVQDPLTGRLLHSSALRSLLRRSLLSAAHDFRSLLVRRLSSSLAFRRVASGGHGRREAAVDPVVRRALGPCAGSDRWAFQRVRGGRGLGPGRGGTARLGMFVLEEGNVEVQTPDGRRWGYGPGEFFGELALLTDHPRNARVRRRPREVPRDARRDFQKLLEEEPGSPSRCSRSSRPGSTRLTRQDGRRALTSGSLHRIEHMFYPGMRGAAVRDRPPEFDTPEFGGITFIESEAKSIINKVPGELPPVRLDDQPVPRLFACLPLLLRSSDAHVPRHERRSRTSRRRSS